MRLLRNVVATLVAVCLVVLVGPATATAGHDDKPGREFPVYLALGDSWAFGEGATNPEREGYAPQLLRILRKRWDCSPPSSRDAAWSCRHLQLVNLARSAAPGLPGVTTELLQREQLPVAVPLLESRNGDSNPRNDVELITVHVGGNDVTGPILERCLGGLTAECLGTIQSAFAGFADRYSAVLQELRTAAGPHTRIVVGTYGNPIPFCFLNDVPLAAQLAAIVLEGDHPLVSQGLNDIIRTIGQQYGAQAANVYELLDEREDFVGGDDCLHPADPGYDKVTAAFARAVLHPASTAD